MKVMLPTEGRLKECPHPGEGFVFLILIFFRKGRGGLSDYDFTLLERKIITNATPSRAHSDSPFPFPSPQPDAVFLFSHCCS